MFALWTRVGVEFVIFDLIQKNIPFPESFFMLINTVHKLYK